MRGNFVDIWLADYNPDQKTSAAIFDQTYGALLNNSERAKAKNFSRLDLQYKYIKTRAELRKVLATYLNVDTQNIILKTEEYGKPYLADNNLYFNLSHTNDKLVIVVSNIGDIGVDIERVKNRKSMSSLVQKCFSEEEMNYWFDLSEPLKNQMFYRFWVRKEAFVKAVGRGISLGLNQCMINPEQQSFFTSIPKQYGLPSNWQIIDVAIDHDHVCAVVTKNADYEYQQTRLK